MSTEEQMKKDLYYMQRALDEAGAAYREGEIPVGAVVVCRDRIMPGRITLPRRSTT